MSKLLILGAGQYGMVAREIAVSMGMFSDIAFLDDSNPAAIGKLDDFAKLSEDYDCAAAAVGNAGLRLRLLSELAQCGYALPVLMHRAAYAAPSARIGAGTFIEPMAVVHTDAVVGIGCIISAGTILNHNCQVGEGCHLNCGTIVRARAAVPANTRTDYGQIIG